MNPPEHRAFPARMAMLAELTAFVEGFCRERGIGNEHRLRVTLVLEELFTNTVAHGHRGDVEVPIDVSLSMDGDDVTLLYQDSAPRYDPLTAASIDPLVHLREVGSRPIGGLGVLLVDALARDARYGHEGGRNCLWLRVPCRGAGAPC
jgi:serine/threonine-protein kinase RsbW